MHVISKRPFYEAARRYPNQRNALLDIYRVLSRRSVKFSCQEEMQQLYRLFVKNIVIRWKSCLIRIWR